MTLADLLPRVRQFAATATVIVFAACSGAGDDGGATPSASPPAGLTYSRNPAEYVVGATIAPNVPTSTGGPVTSYGVAPALPPGLSLNTVTGVLGGTPTASTPTASYTITGANAVGSTTAIVTVTVKSTLPPGSVTYARNPALYVVGTAISPNTATVSPGAAGLRFSISPPPPPGLTLNADTGTISGTPASPVAEKSYTVSAVNVEGSASARLALTVNDVPPRSLAYSVNPAEYVVGSAIPANLPTSAGGAITSYSGSPALPAGLALNAVTGAVTGTPTAVADTACIITGTNSGGSTAVSLRVRVNPPPPPTIVSQPSNQVAPPGGVATFSVVATGGGQLQYQWRRNGTPVSTTSSSSYTTPAVTPEDGGAEFNVVVSDAFGGTTASANASLTVRGFVGAGSMASARSGHTAVLLNNGKVLIAGGQSGATFKSSAELYDTGTRSFSATGSMYAGRVWHSATAMPDGKVLIAGGETGGGASIATAELYDPATGGFSSTGPMNSARSHHVAVLLPNGKVLVVGGESGSSRLSSAELYDPAAGKFTTSGTMTYGRSRHEATLLQTGKVLVSGGIGDSASAGITAELYDPATGMFAATGLLSRSRYGHTATSLPSGKVLIAGGIGSSGSEVYSAETYNPTLGAFQPAGNTMSGRYGHTATLVPAGRVLLVGGYSFGTLASAELYDPAGVGSFVAAGTMATARVSHAATILPNGTVLVSGGASGIEYFTGTEIWSSTP